MKFRCTCGHIIRDQTNSLPYKARFIPDEDEETDFEHIVDELEAFITVKERGKQEEFLRSYFGETYPQDLDTKSIIFDLLTGMMRSARLIYECENCGRVFIQKHNEYDKNVYGTYLPEEDIRGVLRSQRKSQGGKN